MKERLWREASCSYMGRETSVCCLAFDARQPWCECNSRPSSPSGGPGLTQQANRASHAKVLSLRVRSNGPPLCLFEPVVTGRQGLAGEWPHLPELSLAGLGRSQALLLCQMTSTFPEPSSAPHQLLGRLTVWRPLHAGPLSPRGQLLSWLRSQTPGPTFLGQSAEWGSARLSL